MTGKTDKRRTFDKKRDDKYRNNKFWDQPKPDKENRK